MPNPVIPTEHEQQVAVIEWAKANQVRWPELELLYANVNGAKLPYAKTRGGKRYSKEAIWLLKEGLLPGVSDLTLPVGRRGYFGLYLELKRHEKSKVQDTQHWFLERVMLQGYYTQIAFGMDEAIATLEWYLQGESTPCPALNP